LFPNQGVCELEGGTWWGKGATPPQQEEQSCCAVQNTHFYPKLNLLDDAQTSTRNDRFKLVKRRVPDCSVPQPKPDKNVTEFYKINENAPIPKLDKDGDSLCSSKGCPDGLNAQELQNFNALSSELEQIVRSEVPCRGDGNEDKKVNGKDIKDWEFFANRPNPESPDYTSSWYDFNHNGQTDLLDLQVIRENFGKNCTRLKDDEGPER
jgi:hypothetical protein